MTMSATRPRRRTAAVRSAAVRTAAPRRRIGVGWYLGIAAVVAAVLGTVAWLSVSAGHSGPAGPAAAPVTPLSSQSTATVATVNGEAVPVREFELFLAKDRAAAYAYFQQHYGVADGPGFWTTAHGGQTPTAYLEKRALADLTADAVQRALAHQYGLLADPGYPAFLQALKTENARRALALTQHQPVYGPVQYTEANYFDYLLGNLVAQLQTTLVAKGQIAVNDSILRQYYAAHPDQFEQSAAGSGIDAGTGSGTESKVAGPPAPPVTESYAQAKAQVQQAYVVQQYDAYVAKLASAATVHVNQTVLAQIPVD